MIRFESHMRSLDGGDVAPMYFCVRDGQVLVASDGEPLPVQPPPGIRHVLGSLNGRTCVAIDASAPVDAQAPDGYAWTGLRPLHAVVSEELWAVAARAVQIVEWDQTHRFCGRCGSPTEPSATERVRRCPVCGLESYPRVSPAVIVLVTRGEHEGQALLAWSRRWPQPHYSTLAGFVEPGETLEEALAREVHEETGVEIGGVRYFGSQSWPFPHQLMVGYRARYVSGELEPQRSELHDVRWFSPEEVERVTATRGGFSIAGRLIDGWLAEQAARTSP